MLNAICYIHVITTMLSYLSVFMYIAVLNEMKNVSKAVDKFENMI
jgi:hypothetical protein